MKGICVAVAGLATLLGTTAGAATVTLTTIDDGLLNFRNVVNIITVATSGSQISHTASFGNSNYGIFEFDLSLIPDNAVINGVTFAVTLVEPARSRFGPVSIDVSIPVAFRPGNGVVDENELFTTVPATSFEVAAGSQAGDLVEADINSFLSVFTGDFATVIIPPRGNYLSIATLENPTFAAATLTIDFDPSPIPLPAGLPLLIGGLGALAAVARKRPRSAV